MSAIDGMLLGGMHPDQAQRVALNGIGDSVWRARAEAAEARLAAVASLLFDIEVLREGALRVAGEGCTPPAEIQTLWRGKAIAYEVAIARLTKIVAPSA